MSGTKTGPEDKSNSLMRTKTNLSPFLPALEIKTGKVLWRHSLPAGPVRWGAAIDRHGQVLVSLRDGRVICLADKG